MTDTYKLIGTFFTCATLHTLAVCEEADTPAAKPVSTAVHRARVPDLLAKVKLSLRLIGGGNFEMGDWGTESGGPYDIDTYSRPLHKVTLDSFSMMAYKVTYDDFDVFTDATGNERVDMDSIGINDRAPKRPAGVSWYGAKAYCQWLGKLTNLPFDLPTEAQWEFAARSGGKRMLFATDNGRIERPRNFPNEWKHGEKKGPRPDVGSYPPNPVGLYGMSENTGEWVNDWFDEDYYQISPERNPLGPTSGAKKVKRGSVGGTAEIAAMVFMRAAAVPQPLRPTYPNGIAFEEVMVPFPGFSGYKNSNFRCVVNSVDPSMSRMISRPTSQPMLRAADFSRPEPAACAGHRTCRPALLRLKLRLVSLAFKLGNQSYIRPHDQTLSDESYASGRVAAGQCPCPYSRCGRSWRGRPIC